MREIRDQLDLAHIQAAGRGFILTTKYRRGRTKSAANLDSPLGLAAAVASQTEPVPIGRFVPSKLIFAGRGGRPISGQ